jgi:hypothetical protein
LRHFAVEQGGDPGVGAGDLLIQQVVLRDQQAHLEPHLLLEFGRRY